MLKDNIGNGIEQRQYYEHGRKTKGKGIFGDVGKFITNTALDVIPMPGIARDVGKYATGKLIDSTGAGIKKKRMVKGSALYMA